MKRRRWLPVFALAALGTTSLMACILSLDDAPTSVLDSGAESGGGGSTSFYDASLEGSVPDVLVETDAAKMDACWWDGISPTVIVLHGYSFPDHIHVEIVEGGGPPFQLHVQDKSPIANAAELGDFVSCTTSFDDYGGSHPVWGVVEGGLHPNYDFIYQAYIRTAEGAEDPNWPRPATIDVRTDNADGSANERDDATATCLSDADMCTQVPPVSP